MKTRKPAWWQLYAIFPLMFLLLGVEHWWPLPGVTAETADTGIVVLSFFAMLGWVQLNGGLIEHFDFDSDEYRRKLKISVYEPNTLTDGTGEDSRQKVEEDHYKRAEKNNGRGSKPSVRSIVGHQNSRIEPGSSDSVKEDDKWYLN